jgi:hypothetical protein
LRPVSANVPASRTAHCRGNVHVSRDCNTNAAAILCKFGKSGQNFSILAAQRRSWSRRTHPFGQSFNTDISNLPRCGISATAFGKAAENNHLTIKTRTVEFFSDLKTPCPLADFASRGTVCANENLVSTLHEPNQEKLKYEQLPENGTLLS